MTIMEMGGIALALFVGYGIVTKLLSKSKDSKIQELDKDRAREEGRVDRLIEERATLRDQAEAEQGGASEDKKTEFWEEYIGKKDSSDSSDRK